ncbi:MAG: TonB family protein [Candidatus Sulfotelmatobacter sp.]
MGYRALLFCPDEKTAQTVKLVLNDLEFTVEACSEPFAAVKKLMGEHFDGVVVDCDSEQNAVLLFKSARQSASNQSALAVAIVEGQAGVAKAFRIGANLVLTKPINVEQAKGTLRVARGLLRKGDSTKPIAAHVESANVPAPAPISPSHLPTASTPATSSRTVSSTPVPSRKTAVPAATTSPWGNPLTNSAVPASHSSPPDKTAAESDDDEPIFSTPAAPSIPASAPNAAFIAMQQIAKKTSAPLNSKPQAAESPSQDPSGHGLLGLSSSTPSSLGHSSPASSGSFESAAPARSPQAPEPLLSKIARTVGPMDERAETHAPESAVTAIAKPFSDSSHGSDNGQRNTETHFQSKQDAYEPGAEKESALPGNKKILLAVVAVVLLGVVLYFVWAQTHGQTNSGSSGSSAVPQSAAAASLHTPAKSVQPAPSSVQPTQSATGSSSATRTAQEPSQATTSEPEASESASETRKPGHLTSNPSKASDDTSTGSDKSGAETLVVRNGNRPGIAKKVMADTSAPNVIVSADNSATALPNLVNVSTASTPVLQTLTVSQGVSQGLIIRKVQPTYPGNALRLQLEGSVHLLATIGKSGNITKVKTLGGEPLLAQAATDAVKQWKYKPYLLNGEPVEIQTQVTINFKLPR